ncbi:MFS transporter [Lactobacillus sp. CC-MHH1034]|uniref:MFS transporter n=1 Tax=Agrilactobacillus fermenti TaxID=2586909 RepID=UPI001E597E0A|nr:MFS transporter [Agrilactobacillus fermenti]MCD2256989.1 MFS transporter [Agrilactobacillus fermenti]
MNINYLHNIRQGYGYAFFAYFGITSLWVIYLQTKGLTLVEIGLCESIFHIASVLFELPTGVLADRFSYRIVLIGGRLAAIISAILMILGQHFWLFAVGFIFQALSYNLQSGTIDALLYDSLSLSRRTQAYPAVISHTNMIYELADNCGVLIAGFLVHWHFVWTYGIAIVVAILAIGMVLFMKEPSLPRSTEKPLSIIKIIQLAYHTLKTKPLLRRLMLYHALFATFCTTYYFYFQTVMTANHFPGWLIDQIGFAGTFGSVGIGVLLVSLLVKGYSFWQDKKSVN